ncbi:Histone-lysine N-methyltransferase pr-set7 [Liparis tanakae]|uniref:Histone-lysine N-methyltransferase pr-set7 n=1 Tax=Liparis tanakae TaxID=230148 RepID=A0A4Z2GED9_9TELE|nr:Histone-lysine N-methyltransferase pr-set7 [Liparis tanakae]
MYSNKSVDASNEDGALGRLVNDDHISPNCEIKTMVYEGKPHLCLFAATEISPGEEITYNYGDCSYPWRSGCEYRSPSSFKNPCSDDDDKEVPDSGASHGNYDELEPDVEQGNPENHDAEEDDEESDLLLQQSDAAEQEDLQLTPEQDAVEHIKAQQDKPFLEERLMNPYKGRGVFTRESIEASAFVVEYQGKIFSPKDTRRKKYGDTLNDYLFDFSWNGRSWRLMMKTTYLLEVATTG